MRGSRNTSIKRELTKIIMLTCGVALLLACAAFVLSDLMTVRQTMVRDRLILARIIAGNSVAALIFDDDKAAEENLAVLNAEPHIVAGVIFTRDDRLFASYVREGSFADLLPSTPPDSGYRFDADYLTVVQVIELDGEIVGTVYLQSDLQQLYARFRGYVGIIAIVLCVSFLVAYLLSSRLQRRITEPISYLTRIAQMISEDKKYSARAEIRPKQHELGVLVAGFNEMLNQIQHRDVALERHRGHLEEEVTARTAELTNLNAELEKATQHKSEFLAHMSHELRTPLNAVIGFSEMLMEKVFGELNEKQDEYARDIHASGQHLLSLINDILDLSKIEAGRMEVYLTTFSLPAALERALLLVKERAHRKKIELSMEIDPGLEFITADEQKIKQVLVNLLANAIKFTQQGGKIMVKAVLADKASRISVMDTGIGIASDDLGVIFEEFKQVGGSNVHGREGTGLGLTLVRRLVELHGGRVSVKSKVGRGSVFTFTIPMRSEGQRDIA